MYRFLPKFLIIAFSPTKMVILYFIQNYLPNRYDPYLLCILRWLKLGPVCSHHWQRMTGMGAEEDWAYNWVERWRRLLQRACCAIQVACAV